MSGKEINEGATRESSDYENVDLEKGESGPEKGIETQQVSPCQAFVLPRYHATKIQHAPF